ncbi:MAG: extracellular solute-binding protein [Halobacteria archaeon]|nr:extracellular solute-binding protein [Halobacteria archaeon]
MNNRLGRREFLYSVAGAGLISLSGCTQLGGGGGDQIPTPEAQEGATGVSIDDLPDLSGELTVYLGRGEGGLYTDIVDYLQNERYPDLRLDVRRDSSSSLANTIIEEAEADETPADVFWSIDAGALGAVADAGLTSPLPDEVLDNVNSAFKDSEGRWVGISGRARTIPFNTDTFERSEIPDDILAFPDDERFEDAMTWAPSYGAFQSFVTAMRIIHGEDETRDWLQGMLDAGVTEQKGEFLVTNAVANGEAKAGFANHYYAQRLKEAKPDAPLGTAFTRGDAGALINCSGASVIETSDSKDLAANFIRHFLSVELQSFLAERGYEYPLVPGVDPAQGLPTIDELDPPEFDLTRLSEVQPTLELMRDVGVL